MLLRSAWNCERSAHQGPPRWGPEKRGPSAPPLSSRLSLAAAGKGRSQLVRSWAAAAPSPCLSGERASEGRLTRGCPWWLFHSPLLQTHAETSPELLRRCRRSEPRCGGVCRGLCRMNEKWNRVLVLFCVFLVDNCEKGSFARVLS